MICQSSTRTDSRPVLYSIILQHPSLGQTRRQCLCTVCYKELNTQLPAVAETSVPRSMDDLLTNTGGNDAIDVMILIILSQSWSLKKISSVFGISQYLARQTKQLVAEKESYPAQTLSDQYPICVNW